MLDNFKIHFVTGKKRSNTDWSNVVKNISTSDVIIYLGNKLDWKIFKYNGSWQEVLKGKKPDIELNNICTEIAG